MSSHTNYNMLNAISTIKQRYAINQSNKTIKSINEGKDKKYLIYSSLKFSLASLPHPLL